MLAFQSHKYNFMRCFLFRYSYVQRYADIRDGEPVSNEVYGSKEDEKLPETENVFFLIR